VLAVVLGLVPGLVIAGPDPLVLSGPDVMISFAPSEMQDAKAVRLGDTADVTITFTAAAGQRLADFTTAQQGEVVKIIFCGVLIASPMIIEPITGAALALGGLPLDQALALPGVLMGEADCGA
jgi:preprotein translocase subunit SecD